MNNVDSWLLPDGSIVECGKSKHNVYATEFLLKEFGSLLKLEKYIKSVGVEYAYQVLCKMGWVRIKYKSGRPKINILGGCLVPGEIMRNTMNPQMNEAQYKVAKELCLENNVDFLEAINCRILS